MNDNEIFETGQHGKCIQPVKKSPLKASIKEVDLEAADGKQPNTETSN
jgi:hypothetical protein